MQSISNDEQAREIAREIAAEESSTPASPEVPTEPARKETKAERKAREKREREAQEVRRRDDGALESQQSELGAVEVPGEDDFRRARAAEERAASTPQTTEVYVASAQDRARAGGVDNPDPARIEQVRRELAIADRAYDPSRGRLSDATASGTREDMDAPGFRAARLGELIECGGGLFRVECRPAWGAFHNGEHLVELPAGNWIGCSAMPVYTGDRTVGACSIAAIVIDTPQGRSARLVVTGRGEGAQGAILLLVHA